MNGAIVTHNFIECVQHKIKKQEMSLKNIAKNENCYCSQRNNENQKGAMLKLNTTGGERDKKQN